MFKFHTWVLASFRFWQRSQTAQLRREPRLTPGWHSLAGCCHFALETLQRIFSSMRTGNPAEVPVHVPVPQEPPYKHAQLVWQSQERGKHLQLPLRCISLSKDPSSVTSTSATAAADISLHSIVTGHEGKNGHSCLKPWLRTALVSVHLCLRKHVPIMCLPACRAMESCMFVLCRPGSSVPVNKLTKW